MVYKRRGHFTSYHISQILVISKIVFAPDIRFCLKCMRSSENKKCFPNYIIERRMHSVKCWILKFNFEKWKTKHEVLFWYRHFQIPMKMVGFTQFLDWCWHVINQGWAILGFRCVILQVQKDKNIFWWHL